MRIKKRLKKAWKEYKVSAKERRAFLREVKQAEKKARRETYKQERIKIARKHGKEVARGGRIRKLAKQAGRYYGQEEPREKPKYKYVTVKKRKKPKMRKVKVKRVRVKRKPIKQTDVWSMPMPRMTGF
jgi:hypothetical protein